MHTNNDRFEMPIITNAIAEEFCKIDSTSVYTDQVVSITSTFYSYTGDLGKINFKDNTYEANFFTNGKALVHLEGVLRVYFDGEKFSNNGDNTREALT